MRGNRVRVGADGWSPLLQLGRTSLFIYWIHVEMVYGLDLAAAARRCRWLQVVACVFVFFALFMLALLDRQGPNRRLVETEAQGRPGLKAHGSA